MCADQVAKKIKLYELHLRNHYFTRLVNLNYINAVFLELLHGSVLLNFPDSAFLVDQPFDADWIAIFCFMYII
jgi:hypothetical protein